MDIEVRKTNHRETRRVESPVPVPADGQALLRIDTFGLSMNNASFALMGDLMGYWLLFPGADEGWGRVPVFGFADVVASAHPDVDEGTRLFGYLPMSTHLLVEPAKVGPRGFFDATAHRRQVMATVWNHYQDVTATSAEERAREAQRSLLGPLFVTGFLMDDFLDDNGGFGADTVVVTAASSRTALSLAWCMKRRGGRRVIALTSPERVDVVKDLGVYDEVLPYDRVADLSGDRAVYVDFAGVVSLRESVHARYGEGLVHSMIAGMSYIEDPAGVVLDPPAVGAPPQPFMAQLQVAKRAQEWGQDVFDARREEAWLEFSAWTDGWLTIVDGRGPDALEAAWQGLLAGDVDPAVGHQLSLWT